MEFGKPKSLEGIDFTLPPDDARWKEGGGVPRFYVGAPIWASDEWIGKTYPPGTKSKDYLRSYAERFECIELNSTFYRIPESSTWVRWVQSVTEGFRFCPKIPQAVTHGADPGLRQAQLLRFFESIRPLGKNLGPVFFQLPPDFSPKDIRLLEVWLKQVPEWARCSVEFRHPRWFSEGKLIPEAYSLLRSSGVGALITDVAGRRDVLHASITSPWVLLRFVGNELDPTDYERARDWVKRLSAWRERGLKEIYIFIHHPTTARVPELAQFVIDELNRECEAGIGPCLIERFEGLKTDLNSPSAAAPQMEMF